ncbi:MAG: hypothetical protein WA461_07420 [Nitrososphaeraceae archaeon]
MSSEVVSDMLGVELGGNVGSLTPAGMSSEVVLDMLGVELGGNVGSLTPAGMSSDVPAPVAFIIGNGMGRRNVNAGKNKIITTTPVCKEEGRITKYYICLYALNFTR